MPDPETPTLESPRPDDAEAVWSLIQRTPVLDHNALYTYLLWCRYFAHTSVVAKVGGEVRGFVSGMREPDAPDHLFIWQVVVDERQFQTGLATAMICHLLDRPALQDIRFLDATVAAGNRPSQALFAKIARLRQAPLEFGEGFPDHLFGQSGHEAEPLIQIGPLDQILAGGD